MFRGYFSTFLFKKENFHWLKCLWFNTCTKNMNFSTNGNFSSLQYFRDWQRSLLLLTMGPNMDTLSASSLTLLADYISVVFTCLDLCPTLEGTKEAQINKHLIIFSNITSLCSYVLRPPFCKAQPHFAIV